MKRSLKPKLFEGRKVLVMGLGLHGGGVATAKWLVKEGAIVTATDKRTSAVLAPSLRALRGIPVAYVLGEHRHEDFASHDVIVVNPGVPRESEFLETAMAAGKIIVNDASLFFQFCTNPIIAVTGTRGKTTTTEWIAALLKIKYPLVRASGNTPENAFLKEFNRVKGKAIPVVAEMSSWQLEYLGESKRAPHIAVVTNLYLDHLNRYRGIKDYANAKANIFSDQKEDDFVILNADNDWTPYFLKKKPCALTFFISRKPLPKGMSGLFVRNHNVVFRFDGLEQKLFSVRKFIALRGTHNLENLLNAVLAVKLFDPAVVMSEHVMLALPLPRMREEEVYRKGKLAVVNDSCATSPDGTIAAIMRFAKVGNVVLVAGGTDKKLEFNDLAKVVKKYIPKSQLILLEGSATTKLEVALRLSGRGLEKKPLQTLDFCVAEAFRVAKTLNGKTTILFSPGAASFEKFLHEFDRGEKFNALVKKYTK